MPFQPARLALLALMVLLSPFVASASDGRGEIEIPATADILITDGRGVIVGVGEADDGTTFRLALVEGFAGAATLTFVLDDGSFHELEVVIGDRGVSIDGRRLDELVVDRFEHVTIGRETPGSRPTSEASGPGDEAKDEADDDEGVVGVPPVESPPAAPPSEAPIPPDGEREREPAAPDLPAPDLPAPDRPAADPPTETSPADVPTADPPPADDAPGERRDDADGPDRERP